MNDSSPILTEADTCRELVTPAIRLAGWGQAPYAIGEQHQITDGRILLIGGKARRAKQRRADYLLYYRRDFPIAVVEAKEAGLPAENGVQQAREYAQLLGLRFAYATNGRRIIEIDYTTGTEREVDRYATPEELWARLNGANGLPAAAQAQWLEPYNLTSGKIPRYYQDAAIRSVVEAILSGQKRVLATLATGTGKTSVAFQVCWKLWNSRWNRSGEYRRPKILFLADRNILVDDPKDKDFIHFGDARHKITGADPSQARDMYFGIYQALTTSSEDVFRQYAPDFFDLIVIDECHRGSARDSSSWRKVLDYFSAATHFGMTATPLREESRDSYEYFGNPVYTYSLRQGIEDGFLAPYRVHRVITTADAAGWRPNRDELDRYGREIPDEEYQTKDFERVVALRARTQAMAKHLSDFMRGTDRFAKTIVFCVDQEHAAEMRQALVNLNADLVRDYPDYVCRVTADEGAIGLAHLHKFKDVDEPTPVILTTSQLLTTGVDAEMVKNVVLARVVGSRPEFKQIIGRGTRLRVDYGKEFFNIIDFTGTATQMKTSGPSPLRDMLNLMLKRVIAQSEAFKEMEGAFVKLNDEARGEEGFLSQISRPINQSIEQWGIRFDMGVNPVAPEDITKNLIRHGFVDAMLGETSFALDRYGHGFQRSFLYELIKLAPSFTEAKVAGKKEFDPDFTLILFEEPEAFLHPAQQENMAYHLRRLGAGDAQQVIVTSHSPIFVGKVADDLCQIVRVRRNNGASSIGQVKKADLSGVLGQGYEFKTWLETYVNDPAVPDNAKGDARRLLRGATEDSAIAEQEERFRYQLWLDSERASMFFADRVLIVEGATEKALFAWLLARDWHDLCRHRVAIVDAMGKYNLHRYIALLEGFGIPYGLMLDDDQDKDHHKVVNEMLKNKVGKNRLADACFINECMENFLGLNLPVRDDQKPVHTLKSIEAGGIDKDKLGELRKMFLTSLALDADEPGAA